MNGLEWNKLLLSHGAALVLYARQWTRSHADAEDAVQEGFLRFWRRKQTIDSVETALPLLFVSVKHAAMDGIRSGVRREKREETVSESMDAMDCMFETELETRERYQQIQAALEKLPGEQREVLVMKIWGDLTFRMIGETLQVSTNTAASRYRYALETLQRELKTSEIGHV